MCHNSISLQTNGDNRVSTLFSIRITTDNFFSTPPPTPGHIEDYSNLYKDENSYSKPSANLINVVNQDVTRCCLGITS